MNANLKRSYRKRLRQIFYRIRVHPWHQRMMALPFWARALMASILFVFGIIGLLTPISAGWVMLLSSFILVFGLHMVKRQVVKGFFYLRLHRLIEYIMTKFKR